MTEGIAAMAADPPPENAPDEVTTEGETVTIRVTSYNPALRQALEGQEPLARTHQILDVGARALHGAGASAEAEALGAQVEQLKDQLKQVANDTCEHLNTRTDALFGEGEGTVTNRITGTLQEIERLLGDTFDADSKSSAIAKIQTAMQATVEDLQAVTRRQLQTALDPEGDGQWAHSLKGLRERLDKLEQSVSEVGQKLAASQAAAALHDKSAIKGGDYEDLVDQVAGEIAAGQGDVLEHVGTTKGVLDRRAGDFLVTLNPDHKGTAPGRYVIEAQDEKLTLNKAQEKADVARRNREASAVVMVFASSEQAPTSAPFVPLGPLGEMAIVVLDKHQPDSLVLQVAMAWARAAVRFHETDGDAELDQKRIEQVLDRLRRNLEKVSTIKGKLTTASKAIGEGRQDLEGFADEVQAGLDELDTLIRAHE
jgi:hypothetical protein